METLYPENPLLIIDDEPAWAHSLSLSLKISAGINHVESCRDSRKAMSMLADKSYSLVLLDLTMPYINGETLLDLIKETYPALPVIIISGMNQLNTAIRCVKAGAEDFYVKTDERERVVSGILRSLRQAEVKRENLQLKETLLHSAHVDHPAFMNIVTNSEKLRGIFKYLLAIAPSDEPLLITGESGTGKELIAKAMHDLVCPEKPWVAVNVAGLDDMVFSDTLFGHTKGAFTGADQTRMGMIEKASGGILFLDEIGDLSMPSQVKLLRLLQEGDYYPLGSDQPKNCKARIVVATNQNLHKKEADGSFRRDLLYRLCSHRVEMPSLKERPEDLPLLLDYFLAEVSAKLGKNKPTYPPELLTLFESYHFPGNIRELRAMIHDAVSLHEKKGVLSLSRFRSAIGSVSQQTPVSDDDTDSVRFPAALPTLKQMSQLLVEEALSRTNGNQSLASQLLGVTPQALSKRLKKNRDE